MSIVFIERINKLQPSKHPQDHRCLKEKSNESHDDEHERRNDD